MSKNTKTIPFSSLVNKDDSFNPCPNCGKEELITPRFGGCMPMVCPPECMHCGYRFVERKKFWSFKVFVVMSSEEYNKMIDKKQEALKVSHQK